MDEKTLKTYNAINNFITALNEQFGESNLPLKLYNRLVEKTTFRDVTPIKKHIKAFDNFIETYKNVIINSNSNSLVLPVGAWIKYSDRVYIDLHYITSRSDKDTLLVIKQHLMTIYALIHDDDKNISELEKLMENMKSAAASASNAGASNAGASASNSDKPKGDGSKEKNFINEILETTKNSINPDASDPMDVLTGVIGSGVVQKMISGISSGDMDLPSLLSGMQSMMSSMTEELKSSSNETKSAAKSSKPSKKAKAKAAKAAKSLAIANSTNTDATNTESSTNNDATANNDANDNVD
jgi:mRNA-degrading endonuclease HigB of HigAB toxin-antitoxin module